jgi:acetyl-CoA C-acetyltransferase
MTVNRVCGSGAQAVASAAQEIMLGMLDSAVAGGMENMDIPRANGATRSPMA